MDGLDIDSTGKAFGSDCIFSDALYSLNLTTGAATLVGGLGIDLNAQSGMAFDAANQLWMLTTDGKIYKLNSSTGAASFQANVTLGGVLINEFEGLAIADVPEPASYALMALSTLAIVLVARHRRLTRPTA